MEASSWKLVPQKSFVFVEWGKVLILSILLGVTVRGYAQAIGAKQGNGLSLITDPMKIITTATDAVTARTDKLFEGVIRVSDELTDSVVVIRDSLSQTALLLRTFFTMTTSFVIRFTKILQGIIGSATGILQNIRQILMSLMETAGVIIYTAETGMNLSGSVMNGPPGQAMKVMTDLINTLS